MNDRVGLVAAAIAIGVYLMVSFDGLAVVPPVSDDEAWIASSAHTLATRGFLGSDLMRGFFGGERHTYHHMPLHAEILALLFRVWGTSARVMRLVPLGCGLVVLVLVFVLGRRLGGNALGGLAALLLVGLRLHDSGGRTGIPLLDLARIGRYDIMVPVFGLAALACLPCSGRAPAWRWLAIGVLVALSTLAHAYGAFMLVGLLVIMTFAQGGALRPAIWLVLGGFALPLAPWLRFVAAGWPDFQGQLAIPSGRFEIWRPSFYVGNLLHEVTRYCTIELFRGCAELRPGVLVVVVGIPAALYLLLRRHAPDRRDLQEIAVLLLVHLALFGALLRSKRPSYAIAFWPLAVLVLAWLLLELWRARPRNVIRAGMAVLLLLAAVDGGLGIWQGHAARALTTPYEVFESRLATVVPRGARVLGLPRYWLGLTDRDYRSWAVPFGLARSPGSRLPLREALERVDPAFVLLDPSMSAALLERAAPEHPFHSEQVDVDAYLAARSARLIAVLEDPTYGPLRVYRLVPGAASPPAAGPGPDRESATRP